MKTLTFIGSSQDDLRSFPEEARREAGFQLYLVQAGEEPTDWKPMPTIGRGVREIRIHVAGEWRVIHVAHGTEKVYVLHCFQKKSRKTPREALALARQRYARIGADS